MRYRLTIILTLTFQLAFGQLRINLPGDSIVVNGPWTEIRNIVFNGQLTRYSPLMFRRGLQFDNGINNIVTNDVSILNVNSSPMLGARNNSTLTYNGNLKADDGNTTPLIAMSNGGRFVLGDNAKIDLVNNSYFTRQFWILGDDPQNAVFEIAPGFKADYTQRGTVPEGLGSIRLSNCKLVTHASQGLPLGYRPVNGSSGAASDKINSHLVFENRAGSWDIRTNDQVYPGGLWLNVDVDVKTEKQLTINGTLTRWPDYTNHGGIMFFKPSLTLTKLGLDTLAIQGHTCTPPNSTIDVKEGAFYFYSNPYTDPSQFSFPNELSNNLNGNNLRIFVESGATLGLKGIESKLYSLELTGTLVVKKQSKCVIDSLASYSGNSIIFDTTSLPYPGLVVGDTILKVNYYIGIAPPITVNTVASDNFDVQFIRNGLSFYYILAAPLSASKGLKPQFELAPNPANDILTLSGVPAQQQDKIAVIDALGRLQHVEVKWAQDDHLTLAIDKLPAGFYQVLVPGMVPARFLKQ